MIYDMNHILDCGYEIKESYDLRSYEGNISNCVEKAEDPWPFDTGATSYKATDVGSWSFVGSDFHVRNDSFHISFRSLIQTLNCGYKIKSSYHPRSYGRYLTIA